MSALASAAGWVLSGLGALNRGGYAVVFGLGALALWQTRGNWAAEWRDRSRGPAVIRRRFTKALPFLFAVLASLVLLGAALYPPSNHTAVTYRLPRVLHWLAAEQWHWIHTGNYRMNNRACGIEWMSAPLMLFTRSDRCLFLLNFIPFLLLPGLVYSTLTRLGVRCRVAWAWMWLLPTGYAFLLQAGSTGNDTFPTVYALAAMDFALRARMSGRQSDFCLSIVSGALLTGAKASNLPLLLPWAVLLLWARPRVKIRWTPTLGILLLAALVSFLPTAILNVIYCGDWSGLRLERAGMDMKNPIVGIWGNSLLFLLQNFAPPFFPLAGWWNQHALTILPGAIVGPMNANFEQGYHTFSELPTEDWAGLGFGVSLLLAISVVAAWRRRAKGAPLSGLALAMPTMLRTAVLLSPWVALLAYCMKSGMVTGARLISPYYPLLLPALLFWGGHAGLVRTGWWKMLAKAVMVLAIPVLVVTPGRPLWPAHTVLSSLHSAYPDKPLLERALKVYSVYEVRSDPLAGVRTLLPASVKVVGFLGTEDDPEISLWLPFGTRRVQDILLEDSAVAIRGPGVEYAVVGGFKLSTSGVSLEDWLQRVQAQLVTSTNATVKVSEGPQAWHVVRMR